MNPTIDDKQLMGVEKSVRFEENVLFRPIEHQRDLTAEHRDQLWYNVSNIELCALGRTGKIADIGAFPKPKLGFLGRTHVKVADLGEAHKNHFWVSGKAPNFWVFIYIFRSV